MIIQRPLPQRIAVFRALQLGDFLCATPALRALRGAFPDTEIVLIGLSWSAQFLQRFQHLLDGFIEFPGYPGLPEIRPNLRLFSSFIDKVQDAAFDYVIQMHGNGCITNPLISLFAAKITTGFFLPGAFCPNQQTFMPYPSSVSEIQILLQLMDFLGVPRQGTHLEFPLMKQDFAQLKATNESNALLSKYICIHPGARLRSRRWPANSFAMVADILASRGFQIVLTGSSEEAELTHEVASTMKHSAINFGGRTSLGSFAALISNASLMVCNDTAASHIAAALNVPSVVISAGSDALRWAPEDHLRHRFIAKTMSCRPCQHYSCPLNNHPCASHITPDEVIKHAEDLLIDAMSENPHEAMDYS